MGDAIPGGSSPLSSVPDSEDLSQPSLPQPQEAEAEAEAEASPQDQFAEDVEIVDHPPSGDSPMAKESPPKESPRSTRPKRTRAAPPLKNDAPKKIAKRAPKKKKKWDAENILTDPKSPLATTDLRGLLSNPLAWTLLSSTEKQEILSLLPPQTPLIPSRDPEEPAQPDIAALRNDDTFRHDCTTYTENLSEGRFEADWLVSAWAAHERRKVGEFDGFLVEKFEETWEVQLPEDMKPRRDGREEKDGEKEASGKEMGYEAVEDQPSGVLKKEDGDRVMRNMGQAGHEAPLVTTEPKEKAVCPKDTHTTEPSEAQDRASSADQTMATVSNAATTPKTESMAGSSTHAQERAPSSDKAMATASNAETAHSLKTESMAAMSNQDMSIASDAEIGQNEDDSTHDAKQGTKQDDDDRMVVDELQVENSPSKGEKQGTPLPSLVQRSNHRMEVDGDSEDELA